FFRRRTQQQTFNGQLDKSSSTSSSTKSSLIDENSTNTSSTTFSLLRQHYLKIESYSNLLVVLF
ncbi:unnamed protein product, partial [Rotaria magnacalcarata]